MSKHSGRNHRNLSGSGDRRIQETNVHVTKYREAAVLPNRRTDTPDRILAFMLDVPVVKEVRDIPCRLCTWVPRHVFGVVIHWQLKFKNALCRLHGDLESVS